MLKFKCHKNEFKNIELFLFEQEYNTKPEFDKIILEIIETGDIYRYAIKEEHSKFFFVTIV